MSVDEFSRIDASKLWLPFKNKVTLLLAACRARGVQYTVISGFRSPAEQNKLYAQGRTAPGPIVTKARGGQSFHNFGVAVDVVADGNPAMAGLQPDWNQDSYQVLAEEAAKLGLETGLNWKFPDPGHIQWPALDLHILQAQYNTGGQVQVVSYLNKHHLPVVI